MSGQQNPALRHLSKYYSTSFLGQNRIAFFAFLLSTNWFNITFFAFLVSTNWFKIAFLRFCVYQLVKNYVFAFLVSTVSRTSLPYLLSLLKVLVPTCRQGVV